MSSLITEADNGCEDERILPEVEELEFPPDDLSSLGDIQEELDKLEANGVNRDDEAPSSAVDVNVVDHEVTIVADQASEEVTILPELPDNVGQSQNPVENPTFPSEFIKTVSQDAKSAPSAINKPPGLSGLNNKIIISSSGGQGFSGNTTTTIAGQPTVMSQLKMIRPLPEGVKAKTTLLNFNQPKKNVITKVIFTPNNQLVSDSPIIFGEKGKQTIRLVTHSNKAVITSSGSTKAITFAQAKEMGLLSPGKVQVVPSQSKHAMQALSRGSNKTFTMLKSSPTKILPQPTTGHLQPIAPSPAPGHKILIRQAPSMKTGNLTGTILNSTVGSSTGHILQLPVSQSSGQIHQIQLPGKPVQYVRFVNAVTTNTASMPLETVTKTEPLMIPPPITTAATPKPVPVALLSKTVSTPAQPSVAPCTVATISPPSPDKPASSAGVSEASSPSPPPPQYVQPSKSPPPPHLGVRPKEPMFTGVITQKVKLPPEQHHNGMRPRKPCNCTKSQCLKLYCDCFANGEFCFQCNCNCCYNNLEHEEERQKAIKACLERNPNAFRPKIGKGYLGDERRHNKGCNCKRSGCLKNYCECYEAKIPCSSNCKCTACRNVEDFRDPQDRCIVEVSKINQQFSTKSKSGYEGQENAYKTNLYLPNQTVRQPSTLMTQDVVEATCQCLLAQAAKADGTNSVEVERMILEEFGRCLVEIIGYAKRTSTGSNAT